MNIKLYLLGPGKGIFFFFTDRLAPEGKIVHILDFFFLKNTSFIHEREREIERD